MNSEKIVANGWSAELPAGWEDRSMITLVGEIDESGFASNIVVTRQEIEPSMSLAEYAALQSEMMRQEIENLQVLDERSIQINNYPSFQRLQRFAIDGGQIIQQVQTFFQIKQIVFAITGTATLQGFDKSIPAFKRFVETFKLSD